VFPVNGADMSGAPVASTDFEAFYLANYGRVVGQLYALLGDLPEAEDVVQEAFARASQRWPRLQTYQAPEAWVRRVAFALARLLGSGDEQEEVRHA
jgi:RNA polymerase sigma-70 factor, ECF subfamily